MNEPEDLFAKYKVPDEILEKIISYVPSKHNCFLVSKRFHRETVRVTRDKCLVNLTPENVESPGFVIIQREFDEIRLIGRPRDMNKCEKKSFATKSLKFIEKFGFRIKKFLLYEFNINTSDLLRLLRLMPNLIELQLDCNVQKDYKQFMQSQPEPVGILELKLLKKLVVRPCNCRRNFELLDSISCPSLVTYWNRGSRDSQFRQSFSRTLKDIELDMDTNLRTVQTDIIRELRQCHLEKMSIWMDSAISTQIVQLIESQPQLKSLELCHNFVQGRPQIQQTFTPELLRSISNLKHLESLDMDIFTDTIFPHSLVCKIIQMPELKSLDIAVKNDEFIESVLSVRNEQLQSLSLYLYSQKDVGISRIADNFPNLKYLRLRHGDRKVNIKFIDRLKKLEWLSLDKISLEDLGELEVNESVRILTYEPKPELDSVGLKLVQAMPNIEKIILGPSQGTASMQLLDQILRLQNLVEIRCSPNYLLKDEVIACIKNRPQSSKLQRIKIRLSLLHLQSEERNRRSKSVVETYRNQFPIKRMKYYDYQYGAYEEVTLSRF